MCVGTGTATFPLKRCLGASLSAYGNNSSMLTIAKIRQCEVTVFMTSHVERHAAGPEMAFVHNVIMLVCVRIDHLPA